MKRGDKNKLKSPPPPENSSMNLYTDPADETTEDDEEALDEPVESWGWINNVD